MRIIGNVIWLVFAGWELFLGWIVAGLLLCITIIGIPLGLAAFKMLPIVFSPFGHVIVDADSPDAAMGVAIGR